MSKHPTTARELAERVIDSATLPDLYLQLRRVLASPDASIGEVAELVSYDPAATARLLRIANSAMLGYSRHVDTISKAVSVLGTQLVHDVVLAISATRAFSALPGAGMSSSRFWARSVFCGLASRGLAERCQVLDSERLFVEGLLRDIGHFVMYETIPDVAAEALRRHEASGIPLHLAERELLGFDYAAVGAELMRAWNLPEAMVAVTRNHVESTSEGEHALEINLVHIASHLTDLYDSGDPVGNWQLSAEVLSLLEALGLSTADLKQIVAAAEQGVSEARELFVVTSAAA